MKISGQQSRYCSSCNQSNLSKNIVIHHKPCAYVGPVYDFLNECANLTCPKCLRIFEIENVKVCSIVGEAFICADCGLEEAI